MERMVPMDKETTLLDLLGGWLEFVEGCVELAQGTRETFEAAYFEAGEPVDPAVYDAWRDHYDDAYLDTVRQLHQDAQDLVLADPGDTGDMTPREFLLDEVVPLLQLPGER